MKFYVYNPRVRREPHGVYFDGLAYERQADGRIHEFVWQNDTQQWVDVDPNGDYDDFDDCIPDEEMLDVLVRALRSDIRYVLSLIDPAIK